MTYRLLTAFEQLFNGHRYLHRSSTQGDLIAMHFYEDLVSLGRSDKLLSRVSNQHLVLNAQNKRRGIRARRGDGTLGEIIPGQQASHDTGFAVSRAPIATVEIGTEVKILAKAMIKQIDRVIGDLQKQVVHFRHGGGHPICVAVVGVNHAPHTTGYEGDRRYTTDGRVNRHPIQEAAETVRRLRAEAAPSFDEFLVLPYSATNEQPYPFHWVSYQDTEQDYGAVLTRVSREYDRRF